MHFSQSRRQLSALASRQYASRYSGHLPGTEGCIRRMASGGSGGRRSRTHLGRLRVRSFNASLLQLQAAARLPDGPLSEVAMNAALAMIEAAAPQNEIEGALALQMACTHCAAMYVLSRVNGCTQRSVSAYSAAAAKLLRAYTLQVEALRRLRNGGAQHVRVEHIQINDQARALIGPVSISAEVSQETK